MAASLIGFLGTTYLTVNDGERCTWINTDGSNLIRAVWTGVQIDTAARVLDGQLRNRRSDTGRRRGIEDAEDFEELGASRLKYS